MPFEFVPNKPRRYTVVPQECIALLPFSPEPIESWPIAGDFSRYEARLSLEDSFAARAMGSANLDDDIDEPFRSVAPQSAIKLAEEYSAGSLTANFPPGDPTKPMRIDFARDPAFGGFAKAWCAWQALVEELLSEEGFFSLTHTLEAMSDMECAIDLTKRFYYRQASICLRTFIESLVLPLYFLEHKNDWNQWKAGNGKLPAMRSADGILAKLTNAGILSPQISAEMSRLYGALNHAVHGHAGDVNHSGVVDGNWQGIAFKKSELERFFLTAKASIECGLQVAKITSDRWLDRTRGSPLICHRCHSTDFDAKPVAPRRIAAKPQPPTGDTLTDVMNQMASQEYPSVKLFLYTCRACGNTIHSLLTPDENKTLLQSWAVK